MKKILSVVLACLLLFTGVLTGYAEEEKKTLRVAVCADYFPFEYVEDGELKGFDIDLMTYIGALAGFEIEFQNTAFDVLFPLVMQDGADCTISAITITEARTDYLDATVPYLTCKQWYIDGAKEGNVESYGIFMKKDHPFFSFINNAVKIAIADGTVEQLVEKYGIESVGSSDGYGYELTPILQTFPSDWAKENVYTAIELGIANKAGAYQYREPITREDFCTAVANLVRLVCGEAYIPGGLNESFEDTDNLDVALLNRLGIIYGKSETAFAPADALIREEAATILVRMINLLHPVPVTEVWFDFEDGKEISDWASDSVQTICNMGIMAGVGDNMFAPQDAYTTEQAFATLVRAYNVLDEAGAVDAELKIAAFGVGDSGEIIVTDKKLWGLSSYDDRQRLKLGRSSMSWYNDILSVMVDEDEDQSDVVQEYRIANSISFLGIRYMNVKIFSDQTGIFCMKGYNSEFSQEGEFIYNQTIPLTKEQVAELTAIFEENNFWDIPSIHPEEVMGLDGYTIFMEGMKDGKYNIIRMWTPDEQYEISKIYTAVLEFAEAEGLS